MPNIYDNIELRLMDALHGVMEDAVAADFCVGYFNLRGWGHLADLAERFAGMDQGCCRVLVGMQKPPEEQMREAYRAIRRDELLDVPAIARLQRKASEGWTTVCGNRCSKGRGVLVTPGGTGPCGPREAASRPGL